jgi:hypothetical protein
MLRLRFCSPMHVNEPWAATASLTAAGTLKRKAGTGGKGNARTPRQPGARPGCPSASPWRRRCGVQEKAARPYIPLRILMGGSRTWPHAQQQNLARVSLAPGHLLPHTFRVPPSCPAPRASHTLPGSHSFENAPPRLCLRCAPPCDRWPTDLLLGCLCQQPAQLPLRQALASWYWRACYASLLCTSFGSAFALSEQYQTIALQPAGPSGAST